MFSQTQNQDQNQEFGGRKRRHTSKNPSKKNMVVVGKVYADWCGHCQSLKPEWAKMKKRVYSKKGKKHVVFVEVEEKQIGNKLRKLEKDHGVKVEANGYPTLFKIDNGKVHYYNGNRQSDAMADWYLKGGDPEENQIPELLQDQQGSQFGGRRPFYTRNRHRRNRHHHRGYKGTRKHFEKKESGFFDFLFGK